MAEASTAQLLQEQRQEVQGPEPAVRCIDACKLPAVNRLHLQGVQGSGGDQIANLVPQSATDSRPLLGADDGLVEKFRHVKSRVLSLLKGFEYGAEISTLFLPLGTGGDPPIAMGATAHQHHSLRLILRAEAKVQRKDPQAARDWAWQLASSDRTPGLHPLRQSQWLRHAGLRPGRATGLLERGNGM